MKKIIILFFIGLISISSFSQKPLKVPNGVKSGNVTLDSADFINLDGTTSNIQQQLNSKVNLDDSVAGYTAAEIDTFQYMFTINVDGGAIATPTDGTTYYMGSIFIQAPTSLYGNRYITIPNNCTLYAYSANILATGAASSETYSIYIRVNDSSDYELGSSFNVHTIGGFSRMFNSSSLNLSLTAGNKIAIKIVTPTWGTNPTSLIHSFVLFFKTSKL